MGAPDSELGPQLHARPVSEILDLLHQAESRALDAVQRALPEIEVAVAALVDGWRQGGRLIYVGAGTSGRLGALDAAECPPTFGVPADRVVAILAGGQEALTHASETAEDDEGAARRAVDDLEVRSCDLVVGLAASGTTSFTCAGIEHAAERGATTVAVTCDPESRLARAVRIPIIVAVGPEVVAGSTRLSAGTAQKLVCNSISTAAFVRLGRVWDRHMVCVEAASHKLRRRAVEILMDLAGCTEQEAVDGLAAAGNDLPIAVLMARAGIDRAMAKRCLDSSGGDVHAAVREVQGNRGGRSASPIRRAGAET